MKGCHPKGAFKLFCVVFIDGTRVSGKKICQSRYSVSQSCQKWVRLLEEAESSLLLEVYLVYYLLCLVL